MSVRKASPTFTPQARQDFYDILLYSGITWGADQVTRYESTLDEVIRRIREHPESGRDCAHLLDGERSALAGHHLIYYTYGDDTVLIHRILHERRHVTPGMLLAEPKG